MIVTMRPHFFREPPEDGYMPNEWMLALAWAEAVLLQVRATRDAIKSFDNLDRMNERMDYDVPPDMEAAFRDAWTSEVTLVWMTQQLALWVSKALGAWDAKTAIPDHKTWRNALEHLDEALLKDGVATENPDLKKKNKHQAISDLSDDIYIGQLGERDPLRVVRLDELEQAVAALLV